VIVRRCRTRAWAVGRGIERRLACLVALRRWRWYAPRCGRGEGSKVWLRRCGIVEDRVCWLWWIARGRGWCCHCGRGPPKQKGQWLSLGVWALRFLRMLSELPISVAQSIALNSENREAIGVCYMSRAVGFLRSLAIRVEVVLFQPGSLTRSRFTIKSKLSNSESIESRFYTLKSSKIW
jgi:hypothetical protein